MKDPLDLSYGLINKAAHDLQAAEIGIEDEVYPQDEEITAGIQVGRELQQKILSLLPPQKTVPPVL
jgi:hypothetical protein